MMFLKKQLVFNREIVRALNGTESDSANVCEQHLDPLRELAASSPICPSLKGRGRSPNLQHLLHQPPPLI